ncbi:retropepsin-like aspartic protease [Occallatibacter savannae]|uniref:retropepsin-like aspartic protease n=1 Tax=Occallatibacter savannae TaxID=1002691 RepID=UPI000D68F447|nr:retropepsin-like aspartic protease [Occallatibacter savannae]
MKFTAIRPSLQIVLAALLSFTCTFSHAEAHCPAGLPDLHPRLIAGALLVIPVTVNGSGPYDFMVDTGSQLNVLDPLLADQLHLQPQAHVGLVTAASVKEASVAVIDSLQAGPYAIQHPLAAVQDLGMLQSADPGIRGVLGENFIGHFDLLIDYRRNLLCFDQAGAIEKDLRWERIPFVPSNHADPDVPFSERLVISVRLSDTGARPILLQIDSGSDGPILFAGNKDLEKSLLKRAIRPGTEGGEARPPFALLPPQDMKLGSRTVRGVPFVTPSSAAANSSDHEEDGVLATVLFGRIYISHSKQFIAFDLR